MEPVAHVPASEAEPGEWRSPGVRHALRGFGVMYGPSLVIDAWWLSGLAAAVAPALRRHQGRVKRVSALALAAGAIGPLVYQVAVRPRILFWGTTRDEMVRELPGDGILPNAIVQQTRAVTIHAPPLEVWEWLAQIGHGRGGWYSYDRLEAIAGAARFGDGHSANSVRPELQELRVGDVVGMSPWTGMCVAVVKTGRLLVLHSEPLPLALAPTSTWTFCLEPAGPESTRLLVRGRSSPDPRNVIQLLAAHMIEVPHFVMERRMMLGLKERAERRWRAGAGARSTV